MVCVCRSWTLSGQIKVLVGARLTETGRESEGNTSVSTTTVLLRTMTENTEVVCKAPNRNDRANGNVVNACIRRFRDNQKQLKRQ